MASHYSEMLSALIVALDHRVTVSPLNKEAVSACFLFIYDFLLRLDLEARYIWKYPWTLFKVLYLVQRFLPFVDMCIFLIHQNFAIELTPHDCEIDYRVVFYLTTAGILLSYIIQSVRIWCAWRKNNFVKVIIIALTIGLFIPDGIALNGIIRSLEFLDPPPKFRGCIIIGGKNTYTPWILWLAYDTSASILMLIPGISAYREGGLSRLMRVMYQDGVIYFILMATRLCLHLGTA
ncbi:hypothetical protein WG66_013627 [Moniliophthora roreri]|nr:hypothetical protein WG66_013627 [Moniliophthora roreri]